jgi:fumarylacetoacetate (FAA) hydrolase
MRFSFDRLVQFASSRRPLYAGTLISSGTVSGAAEHGSCCLIEKRLREQTAGQSTVTPYLRDGDEIRIEAVSSEGRTVFGPILQRVAAASRVEEAQ